jgi:hypothetical protein
MGIICPQDDLIWVPIIEQLGSNLTNLAGPPGLQDVPHLVSRRSAGKDARAWCCQLIQLGAFDKEKGADQLSALLLGGQG